MELHSDPVAVANRRHNRPAMRGCGKDAITLKGKAVKKIGFTAANERVIAHWLDVIPSHMGNLDFAPDWHGPDDALDPTKTSMTAMFLP